MVRVCNRSAAISLFSQPNVSSFSCLSPHIVEFYTYFHAGRRGHAICQERRGNARWNAEILHARGILGLSVGLRAAVRGQSRQGRRGIVRGAALLGTSLTRCSLRRIPVDGGKAHPTSPHGRAGIWQVSLLPRTYGGGPELETSLAGYNQRWQTWQTRGGGEGCPRAHQDRQMRDC